mgnify:CR=1 FL=1
MLIRIGSRRIVQNIRLGLKKNHRHQHLTIIHHKTQRPSPPKRTSKGWQQPTPTKKRLADNNESRSKKKNRVESLSAHTQPEITVELANTDEATAEEQTPIVALDEVFAFPDIPPVAHEFVAMLQAGTSYELVDWLAKRLQLAAEQLAQEHKVWEMIQRPCSTP